MPIIFLLFVALFGWLTWTTFKAYRSSCDVLKRANEMTATTDGILNNLVTVRRRNRSFRWTNEYPEITYQVDGVDFKTSLSYAEARKGKYTTGTYYTVRYVPSEPSCCIVNEFEKKLKQHRNGNLIGTIILAILTLNLLLSTFGSFFM